GLVLARGRRGSVALAPATAVGGRPVLAGLGLVDGEGPAPQFGPVEGGDGLVATLAHLDEAEAARAAGLALLDELGSRHVAVLGERLAEVIRGGLEGEVADVNILAHGLPSRARRLRSKAAPTRGRGK